MMNPTLAAYRKITILMFLKSTWSFMRRLSLLLILINLHIFTYSQDIEYAKSVVMKLASPELQGRGYSGDGNHLAAEYLSGEYKRIGVLPFGKSYDQPFDISINTFPGEMSVKIGGETLRPAVDYLIESSSPGIKGKFGIIKTDRKGIDTKQKLISLINMASDYFLLIDNRKDDSADKDLNKRIDGFINYLQYCPDIQCKGIIIYTKEKLNWENSTLLNVRPIIILNKAIDPDRIATLELNIENKFIKKCKTRNIVGYLKGRINPDSFLVVTAHYDHLGKMGSESVFPGANDNASGVAMVLSLASYYAKNPPDCSMVFILLSAEEVGVLGAKEFVDHPLIDLTKIRFLVNFDLAGTGEEGVKVVNGSVYKDKFELLSKINTENNLLPKIDPRGAACNSDHCLFYEKGVPCFYIYTQGGIAAYHDIYDRYETLPLTEFVDYCSLMIKFFEAL